MRAMFVQAERDGVLIVSPTRKVRSPSGAQYRPATKALSRADMLCIIDYCHRRGPTAEMRAMLAFMGMRAAEVMALDWGDVDFDARRLEVRRSRTRQFWTHGSGCTSRSDHTEATCPDREPNRLTQPPKTKYSARFVYLDDDMVALMKAAKAEQAVWRSQRGGKATPHSEPA